MVSARGFCPGPTTDCGPCLVAGDANAVEGRDYDLAKLMPFWQLTSEQDWEICERQQRGVNSSAYALALIPRTKNTMWTHLFAGT